MHSAQSRALRPVLNAVCLAALTGVLGVVMFAALRSPLKDDIAWLLYVAHRWMAGKELYVDVIEVNPPLIVWISAIPIGVARFLGISQQLAAMSAFSAIAVGGAWWSACLLRPMGGLFANRIPVFAIIGAVLLIIPAADLGQREHLLVAAFLPYLIVFARTLPRRPAPGDAVPVDREADDARPSVGAAVAVGVLAALGCALKPQYGIAFAALEAVALRYGLRPWRAAPLAAAATLAAYFGLVAIVCPAYLRRAVPLALALYGATDVSFMALLRESAPLLAAEGLAVFLWWRGRRTPPSAVLLMTGMVFAAMASVVFFIDGKDWFYHRLPATVVTMLVLIAWVAETLRGAMARPAERTRDRARWQGVAAAVIVVALFCFAAGQRLGPEVRQAVEPQATTVARLEALIRLHHAKTYMAFSEWIALGFPVVNNTGVLWASRFDSMWALKGELWRAHLDPDAAKEWPVAHWVAYDFLSGCPDIVVVDTREGINYISVLSAAEPAFARQWSSYKQIVAFGGLKVFKRGKGTCINPWVAAEGPGSGTTIR
jgi:hypothetical protein